MARTSKQNETIKALDNSYKTKNKAITDRIEQILLPTKVKLPKDLQALLDGFKDNPLEEREKELYEKRDDKEFVELALGDKIDDFNPIDTSLFASRLVEKISSFTDEKGFYKEVAVLVEVGIPKNSQIKKIKEELAPMVKELESIATEVRELYARYHEEMENESETLGETLSAIEDLNEKGKKQNSKGAKIYRKVLGISEKGLSEWEKDIVTEFMQKFMTALNTNSIKNPADFSPFAKYIKN